MEKVDLTFQYTQSEYVRAEQQYLFASKTITKTSVIVLALFLPATFFYLFFSSFSILSIVFAAVAVIAAVVGCLVYFYMPLYKFRRTSKYHEVYNLIFSNDGIKFKTPSIDSNLRWSIYSAIWESDDFYFLIQAPLMYTLIPKRAFESTAAKQVFEKIVLSNITNSKRLS